MVKRDMNRLYESGIIVNLSEPPKRKPTVRPAPPASVEDIVKSAKNPKPKVTTVKPTNKEEALTTKRKSMLSKIEDGLWEQLNISEWIEYFKYKGEQHGADLRTTTAKDNATMKSLMTNYRVSELRDMIDFIWDAPHTIKPKDEIGVWILSGGWTNNIFAYSKKWKQGKFNHTPDRHKREWNDWKEVTPVPVDNISVVEVVPQPKRKKIFI